jgi:hypothetical protein
MSQTFKKIVGKDLFLEFLEKICEKKQTYYIFDLPSYKRSEMTSTITDFLEQISHCYHKSKLFYINRKRSYNSICTIIRQICNSHSIMFTTKIIYSKSKYNIPYYIYF